MGEPKKKICRLCLNFEDDNFRKLDASVIGRVKALIPDLDLSFPNDFLICSKCINVLERSFEFKRTSTNNNDLIVKEKENSKCEKVDLNSIFNDGSSKYAELICRFCLKQNNDSYMYIGTEGNPELNNILKSCLSELNLSLTPKPAVCSTCRNLLSRLYNFKKDCLSVEEKIQSCYDPNYAGSIDLNKVIMLSAIDDENDFLLGFEVQDEEGTDIFDNIPNAEEEKVAVKRPISEVAREEVETEIKKQKLITDEIIDEELPHFQFDVNLLYNPNKTDVMVEDWLAKVEEYKQKFAWSDYTTIHKVLVKLKDMKELYIWFSNIADIMDWGQWKKKLLLAFPRNNDYHIHLKKMIVRRKKKEETYVSYYYEKIALLEPLNLTEEQKVSCIFGGITDVLVCCVGRVGDYKNPAELLDYFKSCDDKQTVVAAAEAEKEARTAAKPKPKAQFQSQNAAKSSEAKKKKRKCYECHRMGHTMAECRLYNIAAHLDAVDRLKPQNNPKPNEAQARRPPKNAKAALQCTLCGRIGHTVNVCRLQKKLKPNAGNVAPPKKPKEFVEWCSHCQKPGHSLAVCFKAWPKKAAVQGNQKQNKRENEWTRCRDCGQFGNGNPCCSAAAVSHDGNYIGSYAVQNSGYDKSICTRCYKMGHATKDCEEFSRRSYRN